LFVWLKFYQKLAEVLVVVLETLEKVLIYKKMIFEKYVNKWAKCFIIQINAIIDKCLQINLFWKERITTTVQ